MPTLRQKGGLSGFQKRKESEYDAFGAGHSTTSISAAQGMSIGACHRAARAAPAAHLPAFRRGPTERFHRDMWTTPVGVIFVSPSSLRRRSAISARAPLTSLARARVRFRPLACDPRQGAAAERAQQLRRGDRRRCHHGWHGVRGAHVWERVGGRCARPTAFCVPRRAAVRWPAARVRGRGVWLAGVMGRAIFNTHVSISGGRSQSDVFRTRARCVTTAVICAVATTTSTPRVSRRHGGSDAARSPPLRLRLTRAHTARTWTRGCDRLERRR